MARRSRSEVESEIAHAEGVLASLPAESVAERMGWEGIISAAREELSAQSFRAESLGTALYFEGTPVLGSRGIEIKFAGEVLREFGLAISHQVKRYTGLPTRVHLTHGLAGSYGFAIEEVEAPPLPGFEGDSGAALALGDIARLVEAAGADDIKAFKKLAPEMARHAFAALRDFLSVVDSSGASFRLRVRQHSVALDRKRVRIAANRTAETRVEEYTQEVLGTFEGIMKNSRKFEFRVAPKRRRKNPQVITGELSASADAQKFAAYFGKRCFAIMRVTEAALTTGNPRRRYELRELRTEKEHARIVRERTTSTDDEEEP